MKGSIAVAVLVAGTIVHARDFTLPDVTVYVSGAMAPPSSVEYPARAIVSAIYSRIGVRVAWRPGRLRDDFVGAGPVSVHVNFASDTPGHLRPDALAYAEPFRKGAFVITVIYHRIQARAGPSTRAHTILAHVLSHEIGHILQGTDWHAPTGIMKAYWTADDYAQMAHKWLEFTQTDIKLIRLGSDSLRLGANKRARGFISQTGRTQAAM